MTRVLIATTTRLMRDLLAVVCREEPDLECVGTADSKARAIEHAPTFDVLLVSYDLPDALPLVQSYAHTAGAPAVVVMGLPNIEALILRFIEAGALGCVREQESVAELVQTIRLAAARQITLPVDLVPALVKRVSALANQQQDCTLQVKQQFNNTLTQREREILHLIAQGYPNREIARELTIELGTAKNHVHNILNKLNVKKRREAAMFYSLGLV